MKRRATALLVAVAAVFVALAVLADPDATWTGYALAAAEGSLVGGLADWFAVTALFRHPLGIPIPHTAIIRERKDQFGETLGSFVQENFLSPEVVSERITAARLAARLASWLQDQEHARTVSRSAIEVLHAAAELVGDDDVHRLLDDELERAVRALPVAPLAGRALRAGVAEGRHHALVEGVLSGAMTFLEEQREPLRSRFGQASPWWLPGALEDRVFDRMIDGGRLLLSSIVADPNHDLRRQLDERLATLADRLEHDPEMATKAASVVDDLLASPDVRAWTRQLWADLRASLERELAADGTGAFGTRVAGAVVAMGGRLGEDPALQRRVEGVAEAAARYVATNHRDEISALVSATVARWDAAETSDKLELLLGRDLQFIRINGTVVGGIAGLVIHAVADVLR